LGYTLVSPGVVAELAGIMINDPDGHASLLNQPVRLPKLGT